MNGMHPVHACCMGNILFKPSFEFCSSRDRSGIWDLGSGIWDLGSPVETLLLRTCMGRTSHTVNIDNCNSNLYLVPNRSNVSMILEQPEVSAISFPLHFLGISEVN